MGPGRAERLTTDALRMPPPAGCERTIARRRPLRLLGTYRFLRLQRHQGFLWNRRDMRSRRRFRVSQELRVISVHRRR